MESLKRALGGLVFFALLVHGGPAHGAMVIESFDPAYHDRFHVGEDKDFIAAGFSWSGVGKSPNGRHWATMISPSYFLSSDHYLPIPGTVFRFYASNDPDGAYVDRVVASGEQVGDGDFWLGKLSEPVGEGVAIYPLVGPDYLGFEGAEIVVFGRSNLTGDESANMRVGLNQIDSAVAGGKWLAFDFDPPGGMGGDEVYLQGGDSGGPSFILIDGAPALVGIHFGISPDTSYDFSSPHYLDEIRRLAVGEKILAVPEPGLVALSLSALTCLILLAGWRAA